MSDTTSASDASVEAWKRETLAADYERVRPRRDQYQTLSGAAINDVYTPGDLGGFDHDRDLGLPGQYPYTRGVHASMFRGRPWTIRQVAGFGQAEDTNNRYKYLLKTGQTGLSTDFDLPTLLGYDSDHEVFRREVGKIGVAIDTVVDMHALFDEIPLDQISTSMTINPTAAILLAMYRVVGDERGFSGDALTGTTQNDILKEYTAQNEFIFPPLPAVELVVDTMEYGAQVMPRFNPLNACGYHIREAGATAVEEVGLTISAALCYLEHAVARGIDVDRLAPRVSFFWDVHNNFFEEAAKLRAARRLWARLMRERLNCKNPKSWLMRAHCQTAGVSLTAQQPLNNVVRTTWQALAAVLGGTQSLHTNSLDETYALPTEESVMIALRTQQIIAHESGVASTVDPLGGSYFVEWMTDKLEAEAHDYIRRIDEMGGMVSAIEKGYPQREIAASAYRFQREVDANERVMVGVNAYVSTDDKKIPLLRIDEEVQRRQCQNLAKVKADRDVDQVRASLSAVREAARGKDNLMPPIIGAARAYCTEQEICDVLREVLGTYSDPAEF